FHPDYCAEWQDGKDVYQVLICFGCHEVKCYGPKVDLYCDINSEAYKEFEKVLKPYRKNRPEKKGAPEERRATAVNRADLQRMARDGLRAAKALLAARRWSGAYYLAGYAVECALKSCVIAYLMRTDQFPDNRFSERCWTHELEQLVALADLK